MSRRARFVVLLVISTSIIASVPWVVLAIRNDDWATGMKNLVFVNVMFGVFFAILYALKVTVDVVNSAQRWLSPKSSEEVDTTINSQFNNKVEL